MSATPATASNTEQLHTLCLSCGACCDGTLFECLELEPHERQAFDSMPFLRLGSSPATPLPCAMHRNGRCTIYEARPGGCQKFMCTLYQDVQSGRTTLASALVRVAELKRTCARIEALLGWDVGSYSVQRFRAWANDYPGGEAAARLAHPEAFMKYGLACVLAKRHFLKPEMP